MRDSYEEMLRALNVSDEEFVAWGIKEITTLLPDLNKVREMWNILRNAIDDGGKVTIRGYGRDKKSGDILKMQDLYRQAGFLTNICLDPTNNARPQQLMKSMTCYRVGKNDSDRCIGIQNYKLSHIWGYTKNIYLFEAPWNIMYTPAVIDPLTGHETYDNNLKRLLKQKISEFIFGRYGVFIDWYNKQLDEDARIKKIIEICDEHLGDKFYEEMKRQWEKLTPNNMLSG